MLRHEYNGTNWLYYDNYPRPDYRPLDVTENWSVIGSTGGGTSGASGYPKGSAGWRQSSGSVRTIWKWQRNLNAQGQPDPNDNPPSELIVRIAVSASAAAASDTRTGAPNRMPGKEHVDATAMGETGEVQDANNRKSSSVTVVRLMRLPTGNQEQVEGPWYAMGAEGRVEAERVVTTPYYTTNIPGMFGASVTYTAAVSEVYITEPDPNADPKLGDNEFTMIGGGYPFFIPAGLALLNNNVYSTEYLRDNSSWSLSRALPGALPTLTPNGMGYLNAFPRFTSDWNGVETRGLGFSTLNGLPGSNGAFGARKVNHYFEGNLIGTSRIEVFYRAGVYTHALGAAKWCEPSYGDHNKSDHLVAGTSAIPNWFHYYSQAYSAPCAIAYDPQGSAAFGGSWYDPDNGGDHIHLSGKAHGHRTTRLWEKRPGYGDYVVLVGNQHGYGIDSFVRVVTHEYTHKLVHETYAGMEDTDGDGLPNDLETAYHLDPGDPDSTDFGVTYSTYATYADQDIYCQMKEKDRRGNRDADWADDGLNAGTVPGPYDDNRRDPKIYYAAPHVPPT